MLINQEKDGIYMFVTSCDEHGDGCLHTCFYYRANGQEVCLSEKCSDNFLYVGFISDFIAHQRHPDKTKPFCDLKWKIL